MNTMAPVLLKFTAPPLPAVQIIALPLAGTVKSRSVLPVELNCRIPFSVMLPAAFVDLPRPELLLPLAMLFVAMAPPLSVTPPVKVLAALSAVVPGPLTELHGSGIVEKSCCLNDRTGTLKEEVSRTAADTAVDVQRAGAAEIQERAEQGWTRSR